MPAARVSGGNGVSDYVTLPEAMDYAQSSQLGLDSAHVELIWETLAIRPMAATAPPTLPASGLVNHAAEKRMRKMLPLRQTCGGETRGAPKASAAPLLTPAAAFLLFLLAPFAGTRSAVRHSLHLSQRLSLPEACNPSRAARLHRRGRVRHRHRRRLRYLSPHRRRRSTRTYCSPGSSKPHVHELRRPKPSVKRRRRRMT